MPMRANKHCSRSASPTLIAILGRLPCPFCPLGPRLLGKLVRLLSIWLSWQAATAMVTMRRHFPIWMTSGISLPTGTGFPPAQSVPVDGSIPILKLPSGSVTAWA